MVKDQLHDSLALHVERLCESPRFRASPKATGLLRFLAAETLAGGDAAPTARQIAAAVLRGTDPEGPGATAAVRMQAGRLRKLLEQHYAAEGAGNVIRIDLPLREYRLRFLKDGQPLAMAGEAVADTPVIAVAPTRLLVPEPSPAGLAEALVSNLVAELGSHSLVTTIGPPSPPADAGPVAADSRLRSPATFVLDTALQAVGDHVRLLAVLSKGLPARQLWAQTYEFSATPAIAGRSMAATARKLAADVADECGVIVREILRTSGGKPAAELTPVEAMASLWRYWITGSQEDLAFARQALDQAVERSPGSPLLLAFWTTATCQEYSSSLDPRARLPALAIERAEAARRIALGHPWIELVRGYALWLDRHPSGLAAVIDPIDKDSGSPTFRGMLGALRIAADVDPDRGRELLAGAIADSPQPLLWFHFCAALHDLQRCDLDAAERGLARIDAPTRPEPVVLRACVAAARGDLDAARRGLAMVAEALPEFAQVGEVILRRWLADRHVDAIAVVLQPLGIDWFHEPRVGLAGG